MFSNIIWDAFAGLGCMTFTVTLMIVSSITVALRVGMLPDLAEALKRLGRKPNG
jgi:hypothetical protein